MPRYLLCLILLLTNVIACKKGDGPGAQPESCKLASVLLSPTGQAQQVFSFQYDDEGRVKFINWGGIIYQYIYQGNAFTRVRPNGNNGVIRSYIQLNTEGRPSVRRDTSYNGQSIVNTAAVTYEYNSEGQLVKGLSNNTSVIPNLSMVWQNGNMVSYTVGNETGFLDYYTDKPNQELTYIQLQFLADFVAYAPKSKNLLKSMTYSNQQINFNYEFDDKSKIKATTWTATGNPTPIATWQQLWDCD